jgi:hypothetical protein
MRQHGFRNAMGLHGLTPAAQGEVSRFGHRTGRSC